MDEPHIKLELIRGLLRRRVQKSLIAPFLGNVDNLTEYELMGVPEATIVTIVETQLPLEASGLSEAEIFSAIESHRSSVGTGKIPKNLTLFKYVKYRLEIEHHRGISLRDDEIHFCINAASEFFPKFPGRSMPNCDPDIKRPSPPPAEQEEQFVEWLLLYEKEFEVFRKIYRKNLEPYLRLNKKSVLEELGNFPDKESLRNRLGEMSLFYAQHFMPILEKEGGISALGFRDTKTQASIAMLQIKIHILHYILKYKYKDEVTSYMETVCGPLENINCE